jgi:hypothetical protein
MRPKSFDPTLFLDQYHKLVERLARLAVSADIAPARLVRELSERPFTVPDAMRDVEGTTDIRASLESLGRKAPRDYSQSELASEVQRVITTVIAAEYDLPTSAATKRAPRATRAAPPMTRAAPPTTRATPPPRGRAAPRRTADEQVLGAARPAPRATRAAPPAPASRAEAAAAPTQPSAPQRWINAEIEDHSLDDALEINTTYTIAFDIDATRRQSAIAAGFDERGVFPAGVDEVTLTVQLGSQHFTIAENVRSLRVPRAGKSRGKARFEITPTKLGRAVLQAMFHKDGNFVQQMEVVLFVVAAGSEEASRQPAEVTSHGRPLSAAGNLEPRDAGLLIKPLNEGGYDCMAWGGVRTSVPLPVRKDELAKQIDITRAALMQVVEQQDQNGDYVFLESSDISEVENKKALQTLARAGALLYTNIFNHPASVPETQHVGDWLRNLSSDTGQPLKLQILADDFPIPWGLLYLGDARAGATLDWGNFLGFRHIIDQIPLQTRFGDPARTISSKPRLAVSFNINDGIDTQMGKPFVQTQQKFWKKTADAKQRLRFTPRRTRSDVLQAFGSPPEDDQIAYFYCHASSANLAAAGGPGSSCLVMSDNERITLDDFKLDAPTTVQLGGSPLVFINACESAELTPAFYDGFVPYFMAKGARGVIGTECKTPALFAAEWATRFFERFLKGEPIGETFLALRKEFLDQHKNPLGLLYAVYCASDTVIAPAL